MQILCKIDRKNTSGTCHFPGHSLVSWFSKRQKSIALSTAKAKYIGVDCCCAQVDQIPIRYDNTSAINIFKNLILYSRTKHIEIRHHFIHDHVQKGDVELNFISTDFQWGRHLDDTTPRGLFLHHS
jgi:hypothetical protein